MRSDLAEVGPSGWTNAFSEGFLSAIDRLDESEHAALEIELAGSWDVDQRTDGWWVPYCLGEGPDGGPREGLRFRSRERALVAAALIPVHGRSPLLAEVEAEDGYELVAMDGAAGPEVVGLSPTSDPELVGLLDKGDAMLRSLHSVALLLEALGPRGLGRVGRMLGRRLARRLERERATQRNLLPIPSND